VSDHTKRQRHKLSLTLPYVRQKKITCQIIPQKRKTSIFSCYQVSHVSIHSYEVTRSDPCRLRVVRAHEVHGLLAKIADKRIVAANRGIH
jgi:hypothetical protein